MKEMIHGLLMALFVGGTALAGTTGYVSQTGSHTTPFASWDTAATNIQAAVNAVGSGGVVVVTNGVYRLSATLSLTNGVQLQSTAGWAQTILDRQAGGRCVYMSNAVLDGFTVTNGYLAGNGAGLYCATGRVVNCRITGNIIPSAAGRQGAGIYCNRSVVTNCEVVGNASAGDVFGSSHDNGGGLCGENSWISSCTFIRNYSGYGGGVCLNANCTLVNSLIESNTVMASGGGLVAWSDSSVLSNCVVRGNKAGTFGGGLYLLSGATVLDCLIELNGAAVRGPVGLSHPEGGGVYTGGGVLDRCVIRQNAGVSGGGIQMTGGTCRNSLIVDNVATDPSTMGAPNGGGVCLNPYSEEAVVENCTVARNYAEDPVGGVLVKSGSQATTLRNCIIYGNTGLNLSTNPLANTFSHNCIEGWTQAATGTFTNDPVFADADGRLATNSPCINVGSNLAWAATGLDREQHPRKLLGRVDMGCSEHVPPMDVTQAASVESGAALALQWVSFSNAGYVVQRTENLDAPDWQTVGPVMVSPAGGVMSTNLATAGEAGYYRIRLQQWP